MPRRSAAGLTSQRLARRAAVSSGLGDLGRGAVLRRPRRAGAAPRARAAPRFRERSPAGRRGLAQQALDLGADLDGVGGAAGDHHLPHRVVELPDVARARSSGRGGRPPRPAARAERHPRAVPGGAPRRSPRSSSAQEVAEQPAEVVPALPQRRDHQLVAGEPVEQGSAEAARLDRVLQVGVGRRDQAHVHLLRCRARRPAAPRRSRSPAAASPAPRAGPRRSRRGTACRRGRGGSSRAGRGPSR